MSEHVPQKSARVAKYEKLSTSTRLIDEQSAAGEACEKKNKAKLVLEKLFCVKKTAIDEKNLKLVEGNGEEKSKIDQKNLTSVEGEGEVKGKIDQKNLGDGEDKSKTKEKKREEEEEKKKKKKRSSWLPDPDRRWPVQGW